MTNFTYKMGPWASKMRPWSSKGTLLSAGVDFGAFLCVFRRFWEAFWGHFEIILASMSHRFFDVVFGGVLGAFWPPFGSRLGAILITFSLPEGARSEKVALQKMLITPVVF